MTKTVTAANVVAQIVTADCGRCGETLADPRTGSYTLTPDSVYGNGDRTVPCGDCGAANRIPLKAHVWAAR